MSCRDVTAVIDICDEYLYTNKVVVLAVLLRISIRKSRYVYRQPCQCEFKLCHKVHSRDQLHQSPLLPLGHPC